MLFISCNNDDGNNNDGNKFNCIEPLGEMETMINNQTLFQARWTVFEYFDNGALSIAAFVQDQDCLQSASLGITAEPNLERQNFTVIIQNTREPTNIKFWQNNEDAVLGSWEILEGEPNWMQYDEITEESVKGRFQATLISTSSNNFHTLPDTLRLDNVRFEAVDARSNGF